MIQLPQLDTGIQVDAILDLSNNSQYRETIMVHQLWLFSTVASVPQMNTMISLEASTCFSDFIKQNSANSI